MSLSDSVERIYRQFAGYSCPANLWVCEQCGPEWSAGDIRDTPLRSLFLPQLVAVHVMSLGDDAMRYFFPRLMELMLQTPSPVFDFRLADLKDRLPAWQPQEEASVRELADAIWSEMLTTYPLALGYSPIARRRSTFWTGAPNQSRAISTRCLAVVGRPPRGTSPM